MKKTLFYLFLGLLVFISCSDDDDAITVPVEPEEIINQVVLNEVKYQGTDLVEIFNKGTQEIDLSNYWLCLGPGTYQRIGSITPESGNIIVPAGGYLVLPYDLPDTDAGLGLYSSDSFTSAEAIVDFVQYGAGGSPRENVAVEAGIWTAGEFVPTVRLDSYSIEYDGEGDSASDWGEEINPSLGSPNDAQNSTTTFSVTITNKINYLATKVFNTPDAAADPGPITTANGSYSINFKAVKGAKLSFATMSAATNDWFYAPKMVGIDLFDINGNPVTGDVSSQIYLWDAGTEEEDPATIATVPGGGTAGDPDDDDTVRVVSNDVTSSLRTELAYDAGTKYFTLTLTNLVGAVGAAPIVLTPGLVVLHAQNAPLFTVGEPDRGVGLEGIAEAGQPDTLYNWFNETGSQGAPLRLSSSISVFSPGIAYAFNTNSDPWFTQGSTVKMSSGVEEIAEDGNNQVAYEYLNGLGIPTAKSDQTAPIGPGESLTFTIEVPQGQNYKLGFGTMLVQTNDWFISYNNNGVALFDEGGAPTSGVSGSQQTYLFDAGTEEDEDVGFGMYQAPRQGMGDSGPADDNTDIRRVSSLEDVQFGKGTINSAPGVTWFGDPRGGYNLIEVNIQPQ